MLKILDDPPEFTDDEMRAVLKSMGEEARLKAFSVGRPVMVIENKQLVLLYPDGTREIIGPATPKSHDPDVQ